MMKGLSKGKDPYERFKARVRDPNGIVVGNAWDRKITLH
jgi:hypothetical protein